MKKQKFLTAVRILAPGDKLILDLARQVRARDLPQVPGAAALEFVAHVTSFKDRMSCLKLGKLLRLNLGRGRPVRRHRSEEFSFAE
jgi:hypothetical protein